MEEEEQKMSQPMPGMPSEAPQAPLAPPTPLMPPTDALQPA